MEKRIIFRDPRILFRPEIFGGIIRTTAEYLIVNKEVFCVIESLSAPESFATFSKKCLNKSIVNELINKKIFFLIDESELSNKRRC